MPTKIPMIACARAMHLLIEEDSPIRLTDVRVFSNNMDCFFIMPVSYPRVIDLEVTKQLFKVNTVPFMAGGDLAN